MKLCIPADYTESTVTSIDLLNGDDKVCEVYGNLNPSPLLSSGRGQNNSKIPPVDFAKLESYIKHLHSNNMEFNYTINPSCISNYELTPEGRKNILRFVEKLLMINVDSFSVAIPSLIELIKANFPETDVVASTISGVDSVLKAKYFEALGCSRIVLKEDISRDFSLLEKITSSINVPVEVILNNRCQFECSLRIFHYNSLSHSKNDSQYYQEYFTNRCNNDINDFLKIRWIRPEDIGEYEKLGIKYFKVIGRTEITNCDIEKTVKSYLSRDFDGNLVELINNFNKRYEYENIISNKKLDGFLDYFKYKKPECSNICGLTCNYCVHFMENMSDKVCKIPTCNESDDSFLKYGCINKLDMHDLFEIRTQFGMFGR